MTAFRVASLLFVSSLTAAAVPASAAVLATNDFESGTAFDAAAGVQVEALSFTRDIVVPGISDTVELIDQGLQSGDGNQFQAFSGLYGASGKNYFTFVVTPEDGQTIDLESLTFDTVNGTNYPEGIRYRVGTSLNGYVTIAPDEAAGANSPVDTTSGYGGGLRLQTIAFDSAFDDVREPLIIRISMESRPQGDFGQFAGVDNFTLNGTVNPVPEPGSLAAAGAGVLVLFRRRGR